MERYEEEEEDRFEKTAQRMRDRYKAVEAKKQKRQIQVLHEIPDLPSESNINKRKFPPSSCGGSGRGGKLMKKAKEEFMNSREVMNLKALKPSKVCSFSSSSSSGSAVASSPIDAPLSISKPRSLPEDQMQNPPAEKKRMVIKIKLPIREKKDPIAVTPKGYVKKDEEN